MATAGPQPQDPQPQPAPAQTQAPAPAPDLGVNAAPKKDKEKDKEKDKLLLFLKTRFFDEIKKSIAADWQVKQDEVLNAKSFKVNDAANNGCEVTYDKENKSAVNIKLLNASEESQEALIKVLTSYQEAVKSWTQEKKKDPKHASESDGIIFKLTITKNITDPQNKDERELVTAIVRAAVQGGIDITEFTYKDPATNDERPLSKAEKEILGNIFRNVITPARVTLEV